MGLDFVCNQEIIQMARRNLTDNVWHYLTGGAESETTMMVSLPCGSGGAAPANKASFRLRMGGLRARISQISRSVTNGVAWTTFL